MRNSLFVLTTTLSLASIFGCVDRKPDDEIGVSNTRKCTLLSGAYAETLKSTGKSNPDILAGCPGQFENHRVSIKRQRNYQLVAGNNPPPPHVRKQGGRYEILFTEMILKGVPPEVARTISTQPIFRNTI